MYEDEIDEDEVMDEEGRTRLKLKVFDCSSLILIFAQVPIISQVENTIRWRTVKDEEGNDVVDEFGEPVRESNARFVRWSDGR